MSEKLKRCVRCAEDKPLTGFHRRTAAMDGLQTWCKVCQAAYDRGNRVAGTRKMGTASQRRKWNLKSRYGITTEKKEEMIQKQGGVCAICGKPPERSVVDHCHETGKVRGILCHGCNIKLPAVEDAEFREAAVAYLSRWT